MERMHVGLTAKRALVCICLSAIGCGNSTDALIARLGDPDPVKRRAAARELGTKQDNVTGAVAALGTALEDSDLEVCELAATSLGRLGKDAKPSLPALEQALKAQHSSVRLTAALAIQKIDPHHSPNYERVLIESLRSGDGTVFLEVGRMGAEAKWAVPELVKLLAHRQPHIRALSAHALGGIGPAASDAKPSLRQSLRDQDRTVRKAAQNALRKIESPREPAAP